MLPNLITAKPKIIRNAVNIYPVIISSVKNKYFN